MTLGFENVLTELFKIVLKSVCTTVVHIIQLVQKLQFTFDRTVEGELGW